jgi:lauroyl/myristoyl acyltransferase
VSGDGRRFDVRGVFWRQFLRWAVLNVPIWIEPVFLATWSLVFLLWGPGRRGVMENLRVIKPGSSAAGNFLRTYLVFWNYACTIADNVRFKETQTVPDWEFDGWEHFDAMQKNPAGAIMLTAHMGSYDLGAQLFAELSSRHVVMVRAPETDPETRAFESAHQPESLRIDFSAQSSDMALELLQAVRRGDIIAIQGDRVTPGIATLPATLFGESVAVPAGPFALAMAARVPIHPLFVMRVGRRHYRLVACPPIIVERTGAASRDHDIARAAAVWTSTLERVIGESWFQWFAFEPFYEVHR